MATNASRRARERRMRARYRRKIFFTAIVMLIIGAVAGYVLTELYLGDLDLIPSRNQDDLTAAVESTPTPIATMEPLSLATEVPVITAVPTEEPTAEPTAEPTEAPTAEPTEVPTAVPTLVPTEEPTEAPTAEPTATPDTAALLAILQNMMAAEETAAPEAEVTVEAPSLTIIGAEEAPEAVVVATAEPVTTEEVVVVVTPEPTPEPTKAPVIVAYGEPLTFETQINSDGSARRSTDSEDYETLSLTLNVDAYKDPAYFEANYSDSFDLQGNEAAVQFGITLNGYTGSTEIIPQNFLLITFIGDDEEEITQGFQLMDKEIAGNTEIAITSDTASTLYKRYPYNADQGAMQYMVVTAYNNGVQDVYWFEIHDPDPDPTPTPDPGLTVGSTGDEVKRLQAKLIELGLLQGQPDGKFGNFTASAVKELQRRYGMEQTGIADDAFLERLYN